MGQCFHCDDPYPPGQACKAKLYTLLGEELDEQAEEDMVTEVVDEMEQLLEQNAPPDRKSVV